MKTSAETLKEMRTEQARELANLKAKHALQVKAHRVLRNTLKRFFHPCHLVDVKEYTPEEWAAKKEPYGNGALLTLTFEGLLYEAINYGYVCPRKGLGGRNFASELQEALNAEGLYYSQGFAWSLHIYEN